MDDPHDKPLRVLIFSRDSSWGGGVANFTELLKKEVGKEVELEHFRVGQRVGAIGRLLRPLVPLYDAARLAALLCRRSHDVYHLNPSLVPRAVWRDAAFLWVLRTARRRNVLIFVRGWDAGYYRRIVTNPLLRRIFRYLYGGASRILVLSDGFARDLEALGIAPHKIGRLSTMFDGGLLRGVERQRNDERIRVLFLARFVAEKGIYELLEGFRQAGTHRDDLMLCLAGDGPEMERVASWCRKHDLMDRVELPGYVSGPRKAQLLLDADMFVLPTYHGEGCPNSLLEAMGAGLPVVVTPVGGIVDVVRDGENGVVLADHAPETIAGALLSLAEDTPRRRAIGERNRAQAWERYEAQQVVGRLIACYRGVKASAFPSRVLSDA